jgi:hypothetical protein
MHRCCKRLDQIPNRRVACHLSEAKSLSVVLTAQAPGWGAQTVNLILDTMSGGHGELMMCRPLGKRYMEACYGAVGAVLPLLRVPPLRVL